MNMYKDFIQQAMGLKMYKNIFLKKTLLIM